MTVHLSVDEFLGGVIEGAYRSDTPKDDRKTKDHRNRNLNQVP